MVNPKDKTAILILGMHRSGTSAVTAGLQSLGVDLGASNFRTSEENPKGYYEIDAVFRLNDQLLEHIGYSWSNPFIGLIDREWKEFDHFKQQAIDLIEKTFTSRLIGIKDPRFCLLLPFWQDVLSELGFDIKYIHVLRNPLEVAGSLDVRGNKFKQFVCGDTLQSLLLWITYYLNALSTIESNRNILVSFKSLLHSPPRELDRLAKFLGTQIDSEKAHNYSKSFIEKRLKHHRYSVAEVKNKYPQLAFIASFYEEFLGLERLPYFGRETINNLLNHREKILKIQPYLDMASTTYQHTVKLNKKNIELKTEVTQYNNKITLLQKKSSEQDPKLSIFNSDNSNFKNQLESTLAELKSTQIELNSIQDELTGSQRMLVIKDEMYKKATHKNQQLSLDLSDKLKEISTLQEQVQNHKDQIDALREILSSYGIRNKFKMLLSKHSEFFSRWQINRQRKVIMDSGLFDEKFYRYQFRDESHIDKDLMLHFLTDGIQIGAWPNPTFDPVFYLAKYPDVAASGMNPFVHYITKGKSEGRTTQSV